MEIMVSEIISGMKVAQDTPSQLGGILYRKGTILQEKDKEILVAFGVEKLEIDDVEVIANIEKEIKYEKNNSNDFSHHFNQALKVVDNILRITQSNMQPPIMELRKSMQPLLTDKYQQNNYLLNLKFDEGNLQKYDSHHALSVGLISSAIGKWIGLDQGERMQIALAGVLHDIGISKIHPNIINSKGPLTLTEYDEIKRHTLYGYQTLKGTKGLNEGTLLAVLQHHEREDGSGYPLGLKKEKIHLYAKIIAIADIFHAMISKRSFRKEFPLFQAIEQIFGDSFGKLDPMIVRTFISNITNLTIGTNVLLNNNKIGSIAFIDQQNPTKPWVKINDDIINLSKEKDLYIVKIL